MRNRSCIELQNNTQLLPVRRLDTCSGKVGDALQLLQIRGRNAYQQIQYVRMELS